MARKAASDLADKFIVRMPDGLRARIKASARAKGRPMNKIVVDILEEALPDEGAQADFVALEKAFRLAVTNPERERIRQGVRSLLAGR